MIVRQLFLIGLVIVLLAGATPVHAQSCCMPNLGDDSESQCLIEGIQSATIFLMIVPFTLVGAVGWRFHSQLRTSA